ncbi:hypothetical protein B9T64_07165 [Bacillus halotolerans]|uniref:hypothetical protein n=1 Tax=Bacillus halotolerans TaxID=260554 RepID=UPI000BFEB538|nr:hypothetical protein [Bacillus halotolerans]PHI49752.1 hypothetical protein B9T64_07165 [Bacillus halotolerans]
MSIRQIIHFIDESPKRTALLTEDLRAYQSGTFMDGYGDVSGVIVDVTTGITGKLNLDLNVQVVHADLLEQWRLNIWEKLTEEERRQLEEKHGGKLKGKGFFTSLFGKFSGGGNYDHFKNSTRTFTSDKTEKMEFFLSSVYDLENTQHKVTANLEINVPPEFGAARLSVLFPICKVVFSDGKTIRLINTDDLKSVDTNTKEETGNVKGDINIVPV